MKKITLFVALLAMTLSFKQLNAQAKVEDALKFKNDQYDFGKISFGKPVTYTIEITLSLIHI